MSVAVINQASVKRYLGGGDAIGQQIRFGRVPRTATIVGVMEDIRQDSIVDPSRPELYICMSQLTPNDPLYRPMIGSFMELAVRTDLPSAIAIPGLRREIRHQNPHLAIGDFSRLSRTPSKDSG